MNQAESAKKCQVKFGSELIDFTIQNSDRTTLAISVYPDKSVSVVAPINTPLEKIKERVCKRAPWIIKQRIYFAQFLPSATEKTFVAGESFRYLGRQYRLKVIESSEEGITFEGSNIQIGKSFGHKSMKAGIFLKHCQ
ncbi:MAG: YgjP-like metallopeptidase domain-containing protein [Bdellovibrionota bacterium]